MRRGEVVGDLLQFNIEREILKKVGQNINK
jgi:hypothetical protein